MTEEQIRERNIAIAKFLQLGNVGTGQIRYGVLLEGKAVGYYLPENKNDTAKNFSKTSSFIMNHFSLPRNKKNYENHQNETRHFIYTFTNLYSRFILQVNSFY